MRGIKKTIKKIREYEKQFKNMGHDEILKEVSELRSKAVSEKSLNKILPKAFALCVVAADRTIGMRHFDVQLIGGIALHKGLVAEMKTGEGKTLTETCPVFLNALTGKGVHVITVNDYLAKRDCTQMSEVYEYLGMTAGCIYSGMSQDERKMAYQCDITYGTNNEFGFDYLRDNLAKTPIQTVQRGLNFVIIDEVDSVLIDDSKTPLIISGSEKENNAIFNEIDAVVKTLKRTTNYNPDATLIEKIMEENEPNGDYIIINKTKECYLTQSGIEKVERMLSIKLSDEKSIMPHYINQAMKANFTMEKDVDYVVKDGKIVIVDGSTGRLMESRKFSDNLHQALEAKEGCEISDENRTHGTITYQNFFRMYNKMAGMTGTGYTDKYEFKTIYGLRVERIPTNRPVIRKDMDDLLFPTKKQKYDAIIKKVEELHEKGQPILIGTPSVEESEIVSTLLSKNRFSFQVLNAKNHEKEAEIIAQAGRLGSITVATNMAGRGTDIILGGNTKFQLKPLKKALENGEITLEEFEKRSDEISVEHEANRESVLDAGGLAVIGVERFDNRRIDDQLRGRAGRQGDPGYSQFFLSMEDKMFQMFAGLASNEKIDYSHSSALNNSFIRNTQRQMENMNYAARKNTLDYDDVNDSQRKQIYAIRNRIMNADSSEILELFNKYLDEVCCKVRSGKASAADILMLKGQEKESFDNEDFLSTVKEKLKKTEKDLATYENTLPNMLRYVMINVIDMYWIDYINQTISLKETVGITVMGSLKPIQMYKSKSIEMFNELIEDIKTDTIRFAVNLKIQPAMKINISFN